MYHPKQMFSLSYDTEKLTVAWSHSGSTCATLNAIEKYKSSCHIAQRTISKRSRFILYGACVSSVFAGKRNRKKRKRRRNWQSEPKEFVWIIVVNLMTACQASSRWSFENSVVTSFVIVLVTANIQNVHHLIRMHSTYVRPDVRRMPRTIRTIRAIESRQLAALKL